jgi:hypothetical protein
MTENVVWLVENHQVRFILSGSSPRKILRSNAYELYALIHSEIPEFNLLKALNNGLLPLEKAIFVNKRWKTLMNI